MNLPNRCLRGLGAFALTIGLSQVAAVKAADAPDTAPSATAPSTSPSATASISPEAAKIVDQVCDAYGALKSLDLAGTLTNEIEAGGEKHNESSKFTASFDAPNMFRHALQDDLVAGSTGQKAYAYMKSRNMFSSADAPADRVATKDLPKPLPQVLSMQNPSLMLAVAKSPRAELTENVEKISTQADTKLEGSDYQTLLLDLKNNLAVQLLIDPKTHLIRQSRTNIKAMLEARGVPNVKNAAYVVNYTTTTPDAPIKAEQFAWNAPEGARDLAAAAAPEEQQSAAMGLVGKPAPDFKLTGLDGKAVSLADMKGSVFILDFWATWCGPCRQSLPHLNKVYDSNKGAGLKVFAVNLQEDKDKVQKFVDSTKLSIPVLLDSNGELAQSYKADAIPETVLVGKDGKVLKVFVGFDPESEKVLQDAIAAAMK